MDPTHCEASTSLAPDDREQVAGACWGSQAVAAITIALLVEVAV